MNLIMVLFSLVKHEKQVEMEKNIKKIWAISGKIYGPAGLALSASGLAQSVSGLA